MTSTPEPADRAVVGAGFNFTDPASPLAPYYLRTSHVLAVAWLGLVFIFISLQPLVHTDIWAHLKFGQWMITQGRLIEHEPFCDRADQTADYVNFQWLSQIVLYGVYHLGELAAGGDEMQRTAGGVELLRTFHALMVCARLGLLLAAIWRLTGAGYLALAGSLLAVLLAFANIGVLRPQVLAEVCFAALLFLLSAIGRERPTLTWRAIVAVIAVMVLWANTHGSYPVGFLVLGALLAGRVIETGRDCLRDPLARQLAMTTLAAVVAVALLNPHGPWLYWHTWSFSQHPNVADMDEWKRIAWNTPWGAAFGASLVIILLTLSVRLIVRSPGESRWPTPAQMLLLVGFGIQTYLHQRMLPWWAILVPWILAPSWVAILKSAPTMGQRLLTDASVPSFRKTIVAVLLAWMFLMWSGPVRWWFHGEPTPLDKAVHPATPWRLAAELKSVDGAHVPELARWLEQKYADGRFTDRIFSSETQGDYLLWALAPETRLCVYTHVHLFSPERWRETREIKNAAPGWRETLRSNDVTLMVFEGETHPRLRQELLEAGDEWLILVDETGDLSKPDPKSRIVIAVRR